jgi:hypothetical protein
VDPGPCGPGLRRGRTRRVHAKQVRINSIALAFADALGTEYMTGHITTGRNGSASSGDLVRTETPGTL